MAANPMEQFEVKPLIPIHVGGYDISFTNQALWMLGDIFEKSEKKEIAAIYLGRIVRDYPLSPRAGDAKNKLVAFGVPVPQPDPKALAWMQAEQNAVRPKPGMMSKPLSLVKTGPGKEMIVAARNGLPQMQPDTESVSLGEVLTGGGQTRIAGAGGSSPAGNTAVIEVATPGSGAAVAIHEFPGLSAGASRWPAIPVGASQFPCRRCAGSARG